MPKQLKTLEVSNFCRIEEATAEFAGGEVTVVSGAHGSGKTSFLRALETLAFGKTAAPEMPVRSGADEAKIRGRIGDIIVERIITATDGGKPSFKLKAWQEAGNGKPMRLKSGEAIVAELTGAVAFRPEEIARMDSRELVALIKKLAQLDTTYLEGQIEGAFNERTEIGRRLRDAEARVKPLEEGVPDEEVNLNTLLAEQESLDEQQAKCNAHADSLSKVQTQIGEIARRRTRLAEDAKAMTETIQNMRKEHAEEGENLMRLNGRNLELLATPPAPPDLAALTQKIAGAGEINEAVRRNKAQAAVNAEATALVEQHAELCDLVEKLRQQRTDMIEAARMPIPGLSWTKSGVTLDGVPIAQRSTAEQMLFGAKVGHFAHPNMPFLLIYDGGLLFEKDPKGMKALEAFASEKGLTVVVEREAGSAKNVVELREGRNATQG